MDQLTSRDDLSAGWLGISRADDQVPITAPKYSLHHRYALDVSLLSVQEPELKQFVIFPPRHSKELQGRRAGHSTLHGAKLGSLDTKACEKSTLRPHVRARKVGTANAVRKLALIGKRCPDCLMESHRLLSR